MVNKENYLQTEPQCKKTAFIIVLMTTAFAFIVFPWILFFLLVVFHFNVFHQCLEIIYFCRWCWWFIPICLIVFALKQAAHRKRIGLMVLAVILLIATFPVGLAWNMLINLLKNPPA